MSIRFTGRVIGFVAAAVGTAACQAPLKTDDAELEAIVLYSGAFPGREPIARALEAGGYPALIDMLGPSRPEVSCEPESRFGTLYLLKRVGAGEDEVLILKYRWDHPQIPLFGRDHTVRYFRVVLEDGHSALLSRLWRLEGMERRNTQMRLRIWHEEQPLIDETFTISGCQH